MNHKYRRNLLEQMRIALYEVGDKAEINDADMAYVMTLNENLQSLGYCLTAPDILALACSPTRVSFFDSVQELIGEVTAKPMYPDFPKQVMQISEAEYRLHQIVHYFSTYGLEEMFGGKMQKGWLPDEPFTPKTEKDERLLVSKKLELLPMEDAYWIPTCRILRKRERMTIPETEIVCEAVHHLTGEQLASLEVPFKENLQALALGVFDTCDSEQIVKVFQALCKHTGDVLKCVDYILGKHHYHFRTSQKRILVRIIERYPVGDWKANVILSNKKAERVLLLLNYLDYKKYSKSPQHMAVVDSLRDGALQSWEGQAKALLKNAPDEAVPFIAQRPGMLLRMVAWLLRLGYDAEALSAELCCHADVLSTQTLVSVLNFFSDNAEKRDDADAVYAIVEEALRKRFGMMKTPIFGKRVFVDKNGNDFTISTLQCNEKSAEGGYVMSGIAYEIPKDARYVRFFVYWNDEERVDVDLHAAFRKKDGSVHHVGWNEDFREAGLCMSGDITHSDAAEFIDIDLQGEAEIVACNIHLFWGRDDFSQVQTCFAGLMAVKSIGENVELYDPANCFVTTQIRTKCQLMQYGYVDVAERKLIFVGKALNDFADEWYHLEEHAPKKMNIQRYLDMLFEAQNCMPVESRADAEIVLVTGKAEAKNEISLIDSNFFMDAPIQ